MLYHIREFMKRQNKLAQFKQQLKQLTNEQIDELCTKHTKLAKLLDTPYSIARAIATISVFALTIFAVVAISSVVLLPAIIACGASTALFATISLACEMAQANSQNLSAACSQEIEQRANLKSKAAEQSNTNLATIAPIPNTYSQLLGTNTASQTTLSGGQQSATYKPQTNMLVANGTDITRNR